MVGSWCPPNSEVHGLALHGLAVRSFFLSVLGYEFKQNGTWNKNGCCTMAVADHLRRNTPFTETLAGADGLRKIPHRVGIFCL